ncbi:PspA/IM30 family protein [uncultured Cohaesibacter sp.]|uniref:PspA/IM30 family protein n=1 Tax=uncultured Cohaesibacter sp. TaxID=1002546 RepID=UPI0029C6BAE4|nr:PspA/IM30 family protein [uncultured Cohaesibacter sp.]
MSEKLTSRVGRIISGSFNALLDAVEDAAPEVTMEQAIREVDDAIEDVRSELGKIIAAKHVATKKLADKNAQHEDLSVKIDFALKEKREDLAEAAVAQQLDIEAQVPVLEQTIADSSDSEKELEGYVAALLAKRREMSEELKAFRDAKAASQSGPGGVSPSISADISKATKTFERIMDRQGVSLSQGTTSAKTAAQLQELEQLSQENRIKERLTAIKSRLGE